ncbi:hypothetical protein [Methylobacterium planeticum]|uniref:Elements of external origin n=1 Tax=Methylobacterium planeticum TaxID=2615211 RepID=A0A6N6MFH5_9HYPH|nr:hypothetical protein [Methylobacterium planeticum]KAB1068139.1 hypothetical protein F6X51_27185 [Methylobacterium planeticum]
MSEAAIRKAIKSGRITAQPDGTLDPEAVREAWIRGMDPARTAVRTGTQGAHAPVAAPEIQAQAAVEAELATTRVREILRAEGVVVEGELTFNHARTAEKVVQTWQRDQAYAREQGRLISADEAERRWADEVVQMRARLLAIPGECAFELSHLSKHDLSVIDRIVRDAMTAAADVQPA